MPNVVKIQSGYKVQPLSAYLGKPAPAAAPAVDFPKINKEMMKTNFFEYLDFALQFAPAGPEEKEIRAKLASHRRGYRWHIQTREPFPGAEDRYCAGHAGWRIEN